MKAIKFMIAIIMASITFVSCNENVEIQQIYNFSVETMPVQSKIKEGETAEIRCKLVRDGCYDDASYKIRYFQTQGTGVLKLDNGTVFMPNDLYPLDKEVFRLYYTSQTTDAQEIDIYVEDNSGNIKSMTFKFNNDNKND